MIFKCFEKMYLIVLIKIVISLLSFTSHISARYNVRFISGLFCNEKNIYFLIIQRFSFVDSK